MSYTPDSDVCTLCQEPIKPSGSLNMVDRWDMMVSTQPYFHFHVTAAQHVKEIQDSAQKRYREMA